jgi:hypothetical protein
MLQSHEFAGANYLIRSAGTIAGEVFVGFHRNVSDFFQAVRDWQLMNRSSQELAHRKGSLERINARLADTNLAEDTRGVLSKEQGIQEKGIQVTEARLAEARLRLQRRKSAKESNK